MALTGGFLSQRQTNRPDAGQQMTEQEIARFYSRPMVGRIERIFNHPLPPARVTEEQFDNAQHLIERSAGKKWHEISQEDYWAYLLDLCYVELQPDLFNYLFPSFLVRWWEGLLSAEGGPESECCFYRAIDYGRPIENMLKPPQVTQVYEWMVDAYLEGLEAWAGRLEEDSAAAENHIFYFSVFNSLARSVPITELLVTKLKRADSKGKALWWLFYASGLAWDEWKCPFFEEKYGGVLLRGDVSSIWDHGWHNVNLMWFREAFDPTMPATIIENGAVHLDSPHHKAWSDAVVRILRDDSELVGMRLEILFEDLKKSDLGESWIWPPE